ncbi:hypothetical protein [Staphylococcus delphini]|uniref:Phage protein n=1 Tax=Staphylococcus delphini TaxID=53344 RepID=A0AAX0QSQ7_9STAP|nr:hypothetical protein [Staphylococcus delphini]PCF50097.1 hypothetical protein B5C07_07775 [Staphylococcus delphini]PNZ95718.1 hypothetical protein CD148_03315 [Staphylococcus delphini]RIZ56271.1 hypothetical protein CDL68_01650 [Staphylococcus delphini]VED62503.1 Uncharacterised protein [Staphylococcus delphini]
MSLCVVNYYDTRNKYLSSVLFDSDVDAMEELESNNYYMKKWGNYYNDETQKYAVIEKCIRNIRYSANNSNDELKCFVLFSRERYKEEYSKDFVSAYISDEAGVKKLINELYSVDDFNNLIYSYEVI